MTKNRDNFVGSDRNSLERLGNVMGREAVAFAKRAVAGFLASVEVWIAAGLDLAAIGAADASRNRSEMSKHDKNSGKVLLMGTGGVA